MSSTIWPAAVRPGQLRQYESGKVFLILEPVNPETEPDLIHDTSRWWHALSVPGGERIHKFEINLINYTRVISEPDDANLSSR